jgi:microcin C transport system permease protein
MKYQIQQVKFFKFLENRRAKISFFALSFIFLVSLFSDFIANDKPLLVKYQNEFYFPIFFDYYETQFGGDFKTFTDYKDEYIIHKIEKDGFILMPPIEYSFDSINYYLESPAPTAPNSDNILGTDDQGRDIFARLLYGLRISFLFGIFLTLFSSVIGIIIGSLSGYFGGNFDIFTQRFIEIWSSLPFLFILIILSDFITPDFWWLLLIMLLFFWTNLVGLVRAEFLRVRNFEFVMSAKALGGTDFYIIFKHILPNAIVSTLTYLPFIFVASIVSLTSLDFLGFGLSVESASLGEILSQAKNNLNAPWIGISIFLVLSIILTLAVFIGEGVRDAFDPRKNL